MPSAERKETEFEPGDIQTDDTGSYVVFNHGIGRKYLCVELWRSPGDRRDNKGAVKAVTKNAMRIYPDGGIPAGTTLIVKVVG